MSRRVRIEAKTADIVRFDADVIGLKYQGSLSGATMQVARAVGIPAADLQVAMPSPGTVHLVAGEGRIGARHAAFVRVAPASAFTYPQVRQFNTDLLRALRTHLPDTRRLAVTMHGVGFDIDLEDSLTAIIRGCADAIRAGDIPDRLEAITIVGRGFEDPAALRRVMQDLVPAGGVEAPDVAAQPDLARVTTPAGRAARTAPPSLFDIFISFKSEDERYARRVYDTLAANGLRVFFSRASLPQLGSDAYHAQIDKAIEQALHMVVVTTSTRNAMAQWVQYEWRLFMGELLAGRKAGNLITMIGGDMRIEDLPIGLRHREVLRCDADGLERLADFTRHHVDRMRAEGIALDPPSPPAASDDVAHVKVGSDLIVATTSVLWNTSWQDALQHLLLSRDVDFSKGWRMPTLDELSLIQKQALLPATSCYWSGEEVGREEARYMHFDDGHVGQGPKSFSHGVSAVFVKDSGPPARARAVAAPTRAPADAARQSSYRPLATIGAPPGVVLVCASERGDVIVTGGIDGALRVYDPHTGTRRAVLASRRYWAARQEAVVTALELSADGRYVASGHLDGAIHLWDVAGEREIGELRHDMAIGGLAFSPDSQTLVSGGRDGTVRFWEIAAFGAGQGMAGATTKPAPVVHLSCLRKSNWLVSGLVYTAGARYALQIDKIVRPVRTLATLTLAAPFKHLAIAASESSVAATGGDGIVRLYDLAAVAEVIERKQNPKLLPLSAEFKAHGQAVSGLAYFPDGRSLATCAMDPALIVWDIETRQPCIRLQGESGDAFAGVAVVQNGSVLVGALADGRVRLWETT